jgi:hypothetical protein
MPVENGRPALSPARSRKGRAFGGVSIQRKTELGRDLQRRADACAASAVHFRLYTTTLDLESRARLEGKAQAYAHAAELADAAAEQAEEDAVSVNEYGDGSDDNDTARIADLDTAIAFMTSKFPAAAYQVEFRGARKGSIPKFQARLQAAGVVIA